MGWLLRLLDHVLPDRGRFGEDELAERLGLSIEEIDAVPLRYHRFKVAKRSGGERAIAAPAPELKALQRRVLRRLLGRLRAHPAATGFERGHSIVTNARAHVRQAVVIRLDVRDFFPSTRAERVYRYFRGIGWRRPAARRLRDICTLEGALPQGAPTSPRLANLVNHRLDARLAGIARRFRGVYTRYADDITVSLPEDDKKSVHAVQKRVRQILAHHGYALHERRKRRVQRRHQRQEVTGLVVNDGVRLPRETRRWLRAVEHRRRAGRETNVDEAELAGWRSLAQMVERQRERDNDKEAGAEKRGRRR